jgi:PLP dependent protein
VTSPQAPDPAERLAAIQHRIAAAGGDSAAAITLLAVSKTQPAAAIRALVAAGQQAFGENYVQEAIAKQAELGAAPIQWHLIGPLQSNKCQLAARHFDWIHSIDRPKLVPLLARARSAARAPLQLLIQVNIDDEQSKSGCAPDDIDGIAAQIRAEPALRLRGLMAIPAPAPDVQRRRDAFHRMHQLQRRLAAAHPGVDTLSMGMSDDFELAIAQGSTLVRIGSALFGARVPAASSD